MLCFEVWKNRKKVALAGIGNNGVLSVVLTWVGHGDDAQADASNLSEKPLLHVGGLDSSNPNKSFLVSWEDQPLEFGDELRVRVTSSDIADPPKRREEQNAAVMRIGGNESIRCTFCGEPRQTRPETVFKAGIAGARSFICMRCLVFAERLIADGMQELFHLRSAAGTTCSFCGVENANPCVAANGDAICGSCMEMVLTLTEEKPAPT